MEQTEGRLFAMCVCMSACDTQAKPVAVWLMEQADGVVYAEYMCACCAYCYAYMYS